MTETSLSPELILRGYLAGAFPMGDPDTGAIGWYSPDPRAVLPLDPGRFHVSRSLAKRIRSGRFEVTRDYAFGDVIRGCAAPRKDDSQTWINREIIDVYQQLHVMGFGQSVEAWQGEDLVGGLYGIAIGGAFFAESMFSRKTDASKVCLWHLVEHLRNRGFVLLDVQYQNDHIAQFGVLEIPRERYMHQLHQAIMLNVSW